MAQHRPSHVVSALFMAALGGCVIVAIVVASGNSGASATTGSTPAAWAADPVAAQPAGPGPNAVVAAAQARCPLQHTPTGPPAAATAAFAPAHPGAVQIPELGMEVISVGAQGVAVQRVYQGSWSEHAGLAPADTLLTFNRQHVTDLAGFVALVRQAPAETAVPVSIARAGRILSKRITVGEGELEGVTVPPDAAPPFPLAGRAAPARAAANWVVPAAAAPPTVVIKKLGLGIVASAGAGVVVAGVMGNSHAQTAGLRAGDVIVRFNRAAVRDVAQFQRLVARATPETDARIKILRNGRARSLSVMVGEGELEGVSPVMQPR